MNKKERHTICALIAGWEWLQQGSSSEASARGACAADLILALGLNGADLAFYRGWEIYKLVCPEMNDELLCDAIIDFVEDSDYRSVMDLLDEDVASFLNAVSVTAGVAELAHRRA